MASSPNGIGLGVPGPHSKSGNAQSAPKHHATPTRTASNGVDGRLLRRWPHDDVEAGGRLPRSKRVPRSFLAALPLREASCRGCCRRQPRRLEGPLSSTARAEVPPSLASPSPDEVDSSWESTTRRGSQTARTALTPSGRHRMAPTGFS